MKEIDFAILRKMPVGCEKIRNNIWFLEKASSSMANNLINIFNYGYMMGVRAERAKRAKRKAPR